MSRRYSLINVTLVSMNAVIASALRVLDVIQCSRISAYSTTLYYSSWQRVTVTTTRECVL
jgi:hypothetical protein